MHSNHLPLEWLSSSVECRPNNLNLHLRIEQWPRQIASEGRGNLLQLVLFFQKLANSIVRLGVYVHERQKARSPQQ